MNDSPNCCNGWTKLYHPRGPQVTLPIAGTTAADYFASVLSMLDAGFLVDAPGLDAGERKEEVDAVLRITHESNGELTPVVMLYSSNDRLEWAVLRVYLNNADDIAAFEKASGLKLAAIPVYEGDRLARDDSQKAKRYIVKSPRPFIVVMKANPNYSTDERDAAQKANQVYKTPKHKFVRWDGQTSAVPVATQPESAPKALPATGEELFRRLCEHEARLVASGKCKSGELLNHVAAAGVRAGLPGKVREWSGAAIVFAVEAVKSFP